MKKFLNWVVAAALANRVYMLMLMATLVVAGVWGFLNTPIIAFPDLTSTRVTIISQWPGRSAQELERFVSIPLEVELNVVPGKTSLRSISLFGLSVVTVIFDDGVNDFEARQNVANRLANVDLPDGVDTEVLPPQGPVDEVYRYTLQSKKLNVRELKTLQDWVLDRAFKSVPGVADVVSFGGEVKAYEIAIDPQSLAKYNISALDVFQALNRSNVNVGGDVIAQHDQAYVVRGIGLLTDIGDIQDVIVDTRNGVPVLVRNLATVRETAKPLLGYVGRDQATNLVEGIVIQRRGENTRLVLDGLKAKIAELNERVLPDDARIVPFYDRTKLIDFTVRTVLHNMGEGVLLVSLVVLLFLADWRATLICSLVIPFSLLFAFLCLELADMSANLLSLGAIDFGIIVDGTVVMVEGIFMVLDRRCRELGPERYRRSLKLGLIRRTATQLSSSVFFAALIIIVALLPIFTFQKIEGKMFSPLAFTLGFAMVGSLLASLTFVPVLAVYLFNGHVRERHTIFSKAVDWLFHHSLHWCFARPRLVMGSSVAVFGLSVWLGTTLGTEFLPHLNEGSVYVRASLPYSTSLDHSIQVAERLRRAFLKFPEVKQVMSQTGRPNDGTDPTGFFNIEMFVDLHPKDDWQRDITKDELVDQMKAAVAPFQGVVFNFSQPIMDNVEEAVAGVKGSLAVKIFGPDPFALEDYAQRTYQALQTVPGIEDLGIISLVGQPEMRIELDQNRLARYGVSTADCEAVVEMAIGGKAATQMYEGERRFDIRVRYLPDYRQTQDEIGRLLVPTLKGSNIPLSLVADIKTETGLAFVYREDNQPFIAVKFSVRGRDLGSTVAEAQVAVNRVVKPEKGMKLLWKGEFENQQRATAHLFKVIPVTLLLIALLLYTAFGNLRDAGLVFLNIPFSIVGGLLALHLTGFNFSISAGIGFICLFGVSVLAGVILLEFFQENLSTGMPLREAILTGTLRRVRPVVMTALMAILGLLPAALSTEIGSETQRPLAIVVIGGLFTDMLLSLHVFPLIVERVYGKKPKVPPTSAAAASPADG